MARNNKKNSTESDVRPVIFIGLGSSGSKIVSKISDYLQKNANDFTKKFYRYYNITSEVEAEDGTSKEIVRFPLAQKQLSARQAISNIWDSNVQDIATDFRKWWYTEKNGAQPWIPSVKSLDTGAGGMRSIGRALLHNRCLRQDDNLIAYFAAIKKSIKDEIAGIKEVEKRADVHDSPIDCYLFGLLAGGTCSGTLIDTALLIRAGLGVETNLFGVFLLGDVCYDGMPYKEIKPIAKQIQLSNSTYALAELTLVQTETGSKIVQNELARRIGVLNLGGTDYQQIFDQKPFSTITFVGAKNDEDLSFNKGGNQFYAYIDFVAKYYADFFTSEAVSRQIARTVDKNMQDAVKTNAKYPSRPNNFQRIGYMCIQVPKEKIQAIVRHDISETIGVNMFKNADEARCKALLDSFCSRIRWDVLTSDQSEFALPVNNEPIISSDEELPDNAQDFEATWKQTMQSVTDFYAPMTKQDSSDVRNRVLKFRNEKWQTGLNDILDNVLGQTAGQRLSMGSAKWLIESLMKLVNDRIAKLNATSKQLQAELFGEGQNALKAQFDACLQQETSGFPAKSSINPLAFLARRSWPGANNVAQTLRFYRDRLRAYAITVVACAALEPLRDELMIMEVVRKLIAHYAARDIFETNRAAVATVFTEDTDSESITQEIISDRESIEKCFVQPLLAAPASSDTSTSRKSFAIDQVLAEWSGTELGGIKSAWNAIADHIRSGGKKVQDVEAVIKSDVIKRTVDQLRNAMRTQFVKQTDLVLGPAIEDLSVWDAIRLYVEKTGNDPDSVLKKLFTVYLKRGQHFTKLNGSVDAGFQPSPDIFYLCNIKDAKRCFEDLGIRNPDTYLTQLMEHAMAGGNINPMESDNPPRNTIQLFLMSSGDLPYFYQGFESMIKLLLNPPAQEMGDEKNWSDSRFPEWIRKWWTESEPKPYYLDSLVKANRT